MTDANFPQDAGVPESERTRALERFSLIRLLLEDGVQIERILQINEIPLVTKDVAEAAREQLVIGQV